MVASVIVFGLENFVPAIRQYLPFSLYGFDEEGFFIDTGLDRILHGQVWRLVTPIFLHGSLPHLILNMMALLSLGERSSSAKGPGGWRCWFWSPPFAATSGQYLHHGGAFRGMSGVVFALAGYLWVKGHVHPEDYLKLDQQNVNWMLGWLVLGFVLAQIATEDQQGQFPFNMANVAHAVGLGTGMVFGLMKF